MDFPTRLPLKIGPVKLVEGMITDYRVSCKGLAIIITTSWKADSNVRGCLTSLGMGEMLVC